jgi:hypothetical protein
MAELIDWNVLACAAYEAYSDMLNHQAHLSLPMPDWDDLPPKYQEAWREVAKEVCRRYSEAAA